MDKAIEGNVLNEQAVIASFRPDEPTDYASMVRERKESGGEEPAPPTEMPKDETRRKRGKEQDYEAVFIKESAITARTGKMVYIRQEFHDTIKSVCGVAGGNHMSLSGYIDNVLAHHFETYGQDITRFYEEKHKGVTILKNSNK